MEKRYTWVVRFDVAPALVANGLVIDDALANSMIETMIVWKKENETRAAVIAGPCPYEIAREQGFSANGRHNKAIDSVRRVAAIQKAAPLASWNHPHNVASAITRAVEFIESPFNSADRQKQEEQRLRCLAELRAALALIGGAHDLPTHDESNT